MQPLFQKETSFLFTTIVLLTASAGKVVVAVAVVMEAAAEGRGQLFDAAETVGNRSISVIISGQHQLPTSLKSWKSWTLNAMKLPQECYVCQTLYK